MTQLQVNHLEVTRIPTPYGEFRLHLYAHNQDNREPLALVMGDVSGQAEVLVRLHSECYTGDVLGSQRCDCGEQLQQAMQMIADEGTGAIVYLRQEGRGIGLLEKLRAYNLQDQGYDTVEANLMLGHQADERDYTVAARILEDLQIQSVRLLTNNPRKIDSLVTLGMPVVNRIPLHGTLNAENRRYIQTKIERMAHFPHENGASSYLQQPVLSQVNQRLTEANQPERRPYITLSYAQTLDGCIALKSGQHLDISNPQSYTLSHQLRAKHQAILVGIGTVLADNPRLTVRLAEGANPQPVILDSHLRIPLTANLLRHPTYPPLIFTTLEADKDRQTALEALGVTVFRLPPTADQLLPLESIVTKLAELGLISLMVEGGAGIITSFVKAQLVDQLVMTIAPTLAGGVRAINPLNLPQADVLPHLTNLQQQRLGDDQIICGDILWQTT
ncbi:GTP cyclohydrolase II [Anaerolineales bacterium HSG25]|nr:GTP cyclohydrolase II [Anaerolineales bacterium HSG25]